MARYNTTSGTHAYNVDPSKDYASETWGPAHDPNCMMYCCYGVGPAGTENRIENQEKSMLDRIPLYLSINVEDDSHEGNFCLDAQHDKHYEGIYKSTHYVSEHWPEIKTEGGEGEYDKGGYSYHD